MMIDFVVVIVVGLGERAARRSASSSSPRSSPGKTMCTFACRNFDGSLAASSGAPAQIRLAVRRAEAGPRR